MTTDTTDDDIKAIRRRTIDGMYRCLDLIVRAIARDWQHCGKAACLRARRCRGFACDRKL